MIGGGGGDDDGEAAAQTYDYHSRLAMLLFHGSNGVRMIAFKI